MGWFSFSSFKNINVRREEAEKRAFQRLSYAWSAFLKEHEAASKEYVEIKRMWDENTLKGQQVHSLLGLENHEDALLRHADSYDHSADKALKLQDSEVQKRRAHTNELYSIIADENNYLGSVSHSIQESDHISKTEVLQRIHLIQQSIPKIADLNLDFATHADYYNSAKSEISHLKSIINRKVEMTRQRENSIIQIECLSKKEMAIERDDESSIDKEEVMGNKIRKFERKEQSKDEDLSKKGDTSLEMSKIA